MKEVVMVECDGCDHTDRADHGGPPAGWLVVSQQGSNEILVYCSWGCLSDVAGERARE